MVRYFEWMGAALYTSDGRSGSMHGKQFLMDSVYAGIDATNVYGRLDFAGRVPDLDFDLVVNLESWPDNATRPRRALRIDAEIRERKLTAWSVKVEDEHRSLANSAQPAEARAALVKNFEFKIPLSWLLAAPVSSAKSDTKSGVTRKLRLRFSLWQNGLPVDALPIEGWIELHLLSEDELAALA